MDDKNLIIKNIQRRLIGHGALLIFIGGILGFGFLFFLIGKIALWPIPWEIDYQMPGTYDAWRMAHMEAIVNGLLLWLAASLMPVFPFSTKVLKRFALGFLIVTWTIVGLEFGGPATNQIAFFLFYVGVVLVMALMAKIAWRCLVKPAQDDQSSD